MDLERRIAIRIKRAINRRCKAIEAAANDALYWVGVDGAHAREKIEQSFHTASRSLGQSRRHRNERKEPANEILF